MQTFKALVGTTLDKRYQIEKLLGTGGMSVVFKATDILDGSAVTIKMLRDEIADDKDALARFINESKVVSMLSHPNIVTIRAMSVKTRRKYLVMEYIDGISLRTYMDKRGALDFEEVISFSEQILAALEHAHSRGIVHRDIKPQNILVLKDGIIKVTDFGIAKLPENKKGETIADSAIGTVSYISPEQAAAKPTDHRSDLYSFGIMMYEMATGTLPFDDERPMAVLMMQMNTDPIPPRKHNKRIPRGLQSLILTAMEKDPKKRYQTARDMFLQVRRLRENPLAAIPSPRQLASDSRSERNRRERPPSRSFFPIALGIACAICFVGLVSVFYGLDMLNFGAPGTSSLKVPDAMGVEYTEGIEEELGFVPEDYTVTVEYVISSLDDMGKVISQNPSAGSRRKSPCTVVLTVGLGPKQVTFGDYLMMNWRSAQTALLGAGYGVKIIRQENAAIPEGYVYATDPAPGSKVEPGSIITVYVSAGTEQVLVTVPEFKGMHEREAKQALDSLGLLVGKVTYTRSPKEAGTILSSSLEAGTNAYAYITAIDFTVSGGPSYSRINYCPDVLGQIGTEARSLLEYYGMKVTLITIRNEAAAGTVIAQEPSAADSVLNNTSQVTITVSGGASYSQTVEITNLVGRSYSSALAILKYTLEGKCEYDVTVRYAASALERDTVLVQTPAAGNVEITDGTLHIEFILSGGPGYIPELTVPNVVGMSYADARAALLAVGLSIGYTDYALSDQPFGTVIAQSVAPDTPAGEAGGYVNLTLSIGNS